VIRVELLVPFKDYGKVGSRYALESSGILDTLHKQLDSLNPQWRDFPHETGVVQSVKTSDTLVTMAVECDATGPALTSSLTEEGMMLQITADRPEQYRFHQPQLNTGEGEVL